MEELKLSKYIELCTDFEEHPEDVTKDEAIKDFIAQLVVRDFLPMKNKVMKAMEIATLIPDDYDAASAAGTYEMARVTHGLLAYCVNLEDDLMPLDTTFVVYDKLYQYGLAPAIEKICQVDYDRFSGMLRDMINVANIKALTQTVQLVNFGEYDRWIKTMEEFKQTLTPEMVRDLVAISEMSTGQTPELIKQMAQEMLDYNDVSAANEVAKFDMIKQFIAKEKDTSGALDQESEAPAIEGESEESQENFESDFDK